MKAYIVEYSIKISEVGYWVKDYYYEERKNIVWANDASEIVNNLKNALYHYDVRVKTYEPLNAENRKIVVVKIDKF